MKVLSLSLTDLARVTRGATRGSDTLRASRVVLGRIVALRIPPLGDVVLTCTNVVEPALPDEADVVWALSRHGSEPSGFLLLHGLTALRLVSATLGLPSGRVLRELGTAERGIAAAVIAGAFRSGGSDIVVRLGRPDWRGGGLVRLIIRIAYGDRGDFVRIDVPPDWLPSFDDTSVLADASRLGLEIPMQIEVARTNLMALDWSSARTGDAIVFDDTPAWRPDQPLEASLVCGQFAARLHLSPGGDAKVVGEFHRRSRNATISDSDFATTKEIQTMSGDTLPIDSLTVLAAAPIELIAEIGRIVMRADEITSLHPGSVLPLGALTPKIVEIKVGDRTWAEGELVDVDGQLGVRLTSIRPMPPTRR